MPRQAKVDVEIEATVEPKALENLVPIRHMVRWISMRGATELVPAEENRPPNYHSIADIEDALAGLTDLGYDLFDTHYLGIREEMSAYGLMYILKKSD